MSLTAGAEFLASFAKEASHISPEHGAEEAVDEWVDDGINHEHSLEFICDGQAVVLEKERRPAEDEDGGNDEQNQRASLCLCCFRRFGRRFWPGGRLRGGCRHAGRCRRRS